ncbi:uncharacterized protein DEA37_0014590 [Paragonimus westermani]|uniref:MAP kinase-activating death domain-containing protein n=1 Tax=Paragonimus westermani TaxID=34504 RepID=A0A5J4NMR1_9TREM|nr:uncharacterized protein DEA37_0014590 [Paragonimus westermani]
MLLCLNVMIAESRHGRGLTGQMASLLSRANQVLSTTVEKRHPAGSTRQPQQQLDHQHRCPPVDDSKTASISASDRACASSLMTCTGLDQAPMAMLEQFSRLDATERKRLQNQEDRLITVCLHNLISFMVMMHVDKGAICTRVRRIQARCRLASSFSWTLSNLLDQLSYLVFDKLLVFRDANDIVVKRWALSCISSVRLSSDGRTVVITLSQPDQDTQTESFRCDKAKQTLTVIRQVMEKYSPAKDSGKGYLASIYQKL